MSNELVTRKANVQNPLRILIYGLEGVGKTEFGVRADKPVFINIEDRLNHLRDKNGNPAQDMGIVKSWDEVEKQVSDLLNKNHSFKTAVIDSADWMERLCHSKIIGSSGKDIIRANGGYGAGLRQSEALHCKLRDSLDDLRDKKKMNVILTAHYKVRTVKDPEATADYDAFEIKCDDKVASMWREWADIVIFVRYETYVKNNDDEKTIATGTGRRLAFMQKKPSNQAKNAFGLPAEVEFTRELWDQIQAHVGKKSGDEITALSAEQMKKEIQDIYDTLTDEKTKGIVKQSIDEAGVNDVKLRAILKRLRQMKGSTSQ